MRFKVRGYEVELKVKGFKGGRCPKDEVILPLFYIREAFLEAYRGMKVMYDVDAAYLKETSDSILEQMIAWDRRHERKSRRGDKMEKKGE